MKTILTAVILCISAFGARPILAQTPFFADKTINVVLGGPPAGSADLRTRSVINVLRKHIPGNPNIIVQSMLKKYGLTPETDVKLRALYGNHPLRLSALQAGQIDGTVMSMPFNKMAVKMGFRELVQLRDFIKTPQGGLVTTLQKIRGEPEMILRAVKATLLGNRFLKESKNEFARLLAKESGVHAGVPWFYGRLAGVEKIPPNPPFAKGRNIRRGRVRNSQRT